MKLALGSLQTAQDRVSSRPSGLSPQGRGAEKGASVVVQWAREGGAITEPTAQRRKLRPRERVSVPC